MSLRAAAEGDVDSDAKANTFFNSSYFHFVSF